MKIYITHHFHVVLYLFLENLQLLQVNNAFIFEIPTFTRSYYQCHSNERRALKQYQSSPSIDVRVERCQLPLFENIPADMLQAAVKSVIFCFNMVT